MRLPFKKLPPPAERRRVITEARPQIFSYHTRRSKEPGTTGRRLFREVISPDRAKQATRFWLKRFEILVLVIAVVASLINVLLLSSDPEILPADPSDTYFLHDKTVYRQAAKELLAGSLANHNKLTVDVNAVSAALKRQFPELDVVSITLPLLGRRPIVYITSTHPALLLTARDSRTYVIDENGRVLTRVEAGVKTIDLIQVMDESGETVHVGRPALSRDTVSFMSTSLFQLRAKRLNVSTFTLPVGEGELDAYITGQSYFVKFDLERSSAIVQTGAFLAVRHKLQEQGVTPMHYVDVRIAGRAYYQ